jgi:hypothetical protein
MMALSAEQVLLASLALSVDSLVDSLATLTLLVYLALAATVVLLS